MSWKYQRIQTKSFWQGRFVSLFMFLTLGLLTSEVTFAQVLKCESVLESPSELSLKELTAAYSVLKLIGDPSVLDPRIRQGLKALMPTAEDRLTDANLLKKFDEYLETRELQESIPESQVNHELLR